jgi:hypothetical protein
MIECFQDSQEATAKSLTAFYLAQIARPSFLEAMTAPAKTLSQKMEANLLRRWTILAYCQGKGGPVSAREVIDYLGESKETIRSTLERMERDNLMRRINVGRVLHWQPK